MTGKLFTAATALGLTLALAFSASAAPARMGARPEHRLHAQAGRFHGHEHRVTLRRAEHRLAHHAGHEARR